MRQAVPGNRGYMTVNLVLVGRVVRDGVENVYYRAARARLRGRSDGGWKGDDADSRQFADDLGASLLTSSNVWRRGT